MTDPRDRRLSHHDGKNGQPRNGADTIGRRGASADELVLAVVRHREPIRHAAYPTDEVFMLVPGTESDPCLPGREPEWAVDEGSAAGLEQE